MTRDFAPGLTAALLVGAIALSGCAATSEHTMREPVASIEPTPTPVATPDPTPVPTATDISIEEAGSRYLALVEPTNAEAEAWNKAVDASDYATLRSLATGRAHDYRAFADGLVTADWPDPAQATVDALVGELAGEIPIFLGLAASTTDDATIRYLNSFASGSSAQKLRILLGLDNLPVN